MSSLVAALYHLETLSLAYFYCDTFKIQAENDLKTVIWTSCQLFTTVLTSVSVEYVTDMKTQTGEEQCLSCALSFFHVHFRSLVASTFLILSFFDSHNLKEGTDLVTD